MSDKKGDAPIQNNEEQQVTPSDEKSTEKSHSRSKRNIIDLPENQNIGPDGGNIEEFWNNVSINLYVQ